MWLHRRSESPATTDVECYWKKSMLSRVTDQGTFLQLSEMCKPKVAVELSDNVGDRVLSKFLQSNPDNCQLHLHFSDKDFNKGSIHSLASEHPNTSFDQNSSGFLSYAKTVLTDNVLQSIEEKSRDQSQAPYWFEMRYGRITASKIFEVSRCKTRDGSLINRILGLGSFKGNLATKRGIRLEGDVVKQVESEKNMEFFNCGFLIDPKYPFFGVSPDGINDTHVIEIKCPLKESTFTDYILPDGTVSEKCFAQVQTQMFVSKRRKSFFCVAHPDFEKSKKVAVVELMVNTRFCKEILETSRVFWESNVYPKIKQ